GSTFCSPYVATRTGNPKWTYQSTGPTDFCTDPAISPDGTIYFGSRTDLHALNVDGSVKWRAGPCWPLMATAISPDGTVFSSSWSDGLFAYKPDGTLRWHHSEYAWNSSAPAFATDGTVYVGTDF